MIEKSLAEQLISDVLGACACDKLRTAARRITRRYNEALKPAGLTATQFTILTTICLTDGATLTELADHLGMERTTFLRNLGPLERQALIKTNDHGHGHGRARTTKLTKKGTAVMAIALPLWRQAQQALKKQLGNETWNQVHTGLTAICSLI